MHPSNRVQSIDLLRGLVMIVMALDHVRDYFHADAFLYNPTDLQHTSTALFFTRWITHFCAPVFVFLSGTSAFLVGSRKGKGELSRFLLKRGLWLVFLELTVVNFAWYFNVQFPLVSLFVIWVIGMGMVVLAGMIYLPLPVVVATGFIMIFGHNLLDHVHVTGEGAAAMGWSLLHEFRFFSLTEHLGMFVGYPLIPWVGVMMVGYGFGTFYLPSWHASRRRRVLLWIGAATVLLFIAVRFTNAYGDPSPWSVQANPVFTVLSFINVSKYPPSLLYVLVTLGPAILFLAVSERFTSGLAAKVIVLGRVPMFYYLLHIYLIHLLAIAAALSTGYSLSDMIFSTWVTNSPALKGYGFGLGVVYLVWIGVVLALYPLCAWYDRYKAAHREKWWLSYL